jgi:DNA modification methylase
VKSDAIANNSVELVFTDPPYDRHSLELYADAARIAARILKPGGSLIAYCGQYLLPDILPLMQQHLKFWWVNACVHSGRSARMKEYGIIVGWKPMLWFVKGRCRGDKQTFVSDVASGGREKSHHNWQQAEEEAAYYIEKVTSARGLVVDFFAGGGTTCVAAQKLGRPWIAFEINPVTAKRADKRIADL